MPIESLLQELCRFAPDFNCNQDETGIGVLGIPHYLENRSTIEDLLRDGHDFRDAHVDLGGMLNNRHTRVLLALRRNLGNSQTGRLLL